LGDELPKWLAFIGGAAARGPEGRGGKEFRDETRVKEMEDCMFDAADVDVYW
jgi:hypothetical protein